MLKTGKNQQKERLGAQHASILPVKHVAENGRKQAKSSKRSDFSASTRTELVLATAKNVPHCFLEMFKSAPLKVCCEKEPQRISRDYHYGGRVRRRVRPFSGDGDFKVTFFAKKVT